MYEHLLSLVSNYSKSFFYLGIGSCPHVYKPEDLTSKDDQLLPCFVKEKLQHDERIQILHIDPAFYQKWNFLNEYFSKHLPGCFYVMESEDIHVWETNQIQVICASTRFHHPNPPHSSEDTTWFLESLTEDAIVNGYQMVYQEYTGYYTQSVFKKIYENCSDRLKQRFRNQILFDISYNTDHGCSTDMVKYKPIYQANGAFLNILLYSNEELYTKLDTHPMIREILAKNLISSYRQALNTIHVDYRRAMNGDPVFHAGLYGYNEGATPADIMKVLQREISKSVPLLQKTGLLSVEDSKKLESYFQSYTTIDRYKWYELVSSLVKFEHAQRLGQPA